MHGSSILRKTHCTAYHAWDEQGQTVQEKEREYGERQLCMEEQLLPQYPPVMACFSAQAITSGLKDVAAKTWQNVQLVASTMGRGV